MLIHTNYPYFVAKCNGQQDIVISPDGTYVISEGKQVKVKCTMNNNIEMLSTVGLEKQVGLKYKKQQVVTVTGNTSHHYSVSKHQTTIIVNVNTFSVVYNATVQDNGAYRCFYKAYPKKMTSNSTEIVVEGNVHILAITELYILHNCTITNK